MKAYNLALFLFILQVSSVLLLYGQVFPGANPFPEDTSLTNYYKAQVESGNVSVNTDTGLSGELESLNKGLTGFMSLAKALFNVKGTLMIFLPAEAEPVALMLALVVYIIWIIGHSQFLRNASFEFYT